MAAAHPKPSRAPIPAEPCARPALSRRALLGAICAAPVFTRPPGLDPEPMNAAFEYPHNPSSWTLNQIQADDVWQKALASFTRAEARIRALEGGAPDDVFNAALDAFNAALRRLLAAPAPDLPALAGKLEAAVEAEVADLTYAPPALEALAQDARRLAAAES